jgi:triosephosphate isomerase
MLVVNLKNYVFGAKTLDLVRQIDIYCNKSIIAVPLVDLVNIVGNTTLPVFAQHVDFHEMGRSTGFTTPESLQGSGAAGSLLNHCEHKLKFADLKKTVERCNERGFKLIVCASNLREAQKIKALNPYAIAFEDPELIASGKSVTTHKSESIQKFVNLIKDTNIIPLCGAGITTSDDVKEALRLGCRGVLVSSAIANSQNPEKFLKEAGPLF